MQIYTSHLRTIFLIICFVFVGFSAFADAVVTMPTGGRNISNDKSSVGPSPAYTPLGSITIAEAAPGDFTAGANRTLSFTRPTGWRFNTGVGSVAISGSNISNASIVVTATTVTVTYTVTGATNGTNSITISGVEIQSTTKTIVPEIFLTRGGNGVIKGFVTGAPVAPLSKIAGNYVKLISLLPNETLSPGSTTGKTAVGTTIKNTGESVAVTVYAVDYAFNIVTSVNDEVAITSNDLYAGLPLNANLVQGTKVFNVTLPTVSTARNITAKSVADAQISPGVTTNFRVNVGAFSKLLVVMPGETFAPGSPTGKTGAPTNPVAGTNYRLTIYAVDDYWNRVVSTDNVSANITGASNFVGPAAVNLNNGSATRDLNFKVAGETPTATVVDNTNNAISAYTKVLPVVNTGVYAKLQILLPNETSAPGTTTGKVSTGVYTTTSGSSVQVTVNAVDANWNIVSTANNIIHITSNDVNAVIPADEPLVNGSAVFNVVVNTPSTARRITATDDSTPTNKTVNTTNFTVEFGVFSKLLVLYPGESLSPGSPSGKSGVPSAPIAGTAYNVTVYAVDNNWNVITSVTDNVSVQISNVTNFTNPASKNLVAGKATFALTFRVSGQTPGLTATDETNLAIIPYDEALPTVVPGVFTKLVMTLPGESFDLGNPPGKIGTPNNAIAGQPIQAVVRALDAYGNWVTSVTDIVGISSNDVNATMPSNINLVGGEAIFNVNLVTAIATVSRTITVRDVTDGSKTSNTSSAFSVEPGPYAKLLVLLPNQALASGTATGKTGNPTIPARGTQFAIRIRAVDQYYNPVNNITNKITVTTSDGLATINPVSPNLVATGYRNVNVTLRSSGSQTITIVDDINNPSITEIITVPDPTAASTASNYFRSARDGVWTNSYSWETSADGVSGWFPATLAPTANASKISILAGHTITIMGTLNPVDNVEIVNGGTLVVQAGTTTLSNNGILVKGILINRSVISTTGGKLTVDAGGKYTHDIATASTAIPNGVNVTWNEGSVCEVSGYTTYAGAIGGTNQSFSDFVWNASRQNVSTGPNLQSGFSARDFTIISTGTGSLNLTAASGTITVRRNFELQDGVVNILKVNGSGDLYIAGDLIIKGGTLRAGTATGIKTITFNGTGTQKYSRTGGSLEGALSFALANNTTVDFGTSVIDNVSGTFTMGSGVTLITAHPDGFTATGNLTGTLQTTGTKTYATGNYVYNGTVLQQTGNGLPLTVNNLTINNSQGVSMPATSVTYTVNGQLTINPTATAYLDLGTNILAGTYTDIGAGRIITRSNTGLPSGKVWTVGVEYGASTAQNILPGTYNGLLATSGAGVKTSPAGTFSIIGNWSSSGGRVNFDNSNIVFEGTNQSLVDLGSDGGSGLSFKNVTFSNGGVKTLSQGKFSVKTDGLLTMGANTELNSNGNLTIKSDAASSGTIAQVPSTAKITGSVRVERFITGGAADPYRTYRLLSSPIYDNTNTFINSNSYGNRSYSYSQYIDDMWLPGPTGSSGFDAVGSSIWKYVDGFVLISNINDRENIGKGTYLFYRGDRTNNLANKTKTPYANPESITMDFKGILNQGSISVPLTYYASVEGFNLLGNPYAATIDWNSSGLDKAGLINNAVRHYSPVDKKYAVYDGDTGVGINGASRYIVSGEGFFVESKVSGGAFTFNENAKITSQPSIPLMMAIDDPGVSVARSSGKLSVATVAVANPAVNTVPLLKLKLSNQQNTRNDETAILFIADKKAEYDKAEDIKFLKSRDQEIALYSYSEDGIPLAINKMPDITTLNKPVQLAYEHISAMGKDFIFELNASDMPANYTLQLHDKYLNTTTPIRGNTTYNFSIDAAISESSAKDRFTISGVFEGTLAVTLQDFAISKVKEGVNIAWTTSDETNNKAFVVERTDENGTVALIERLPGQQSVNKYLVTDKKPMPGYNYYTLYSINNNGEKEELKKGFVKYDTNLNTYAALNLYPNPVQADFTLKYNGALTSDTYTVKIIGLSGQILLTKNIKAKELLEGHSLNIIGYTAGTYIAEIYDAKGGKRLATAKFIKL